MGTPTVEKRAVFEKEICRGGSLVEGMEKLSSDASELGIEPNETGCRVGRLRHPQGAQAEGLVQVAEAEREPAQVEGAPGHSADNIELEVGIGGLLFPCQSPQRSKRIF